MLTQIKIEKLFGQFDYDLELKEGGITILTGPNGYGKTTILKVLQAIDHLNHFFLFDLPFNAITITFGWEFDWIKIEKEEKGIRLTSKYETNKFFNKDDYLLLIGKELEKRKLKNIEKNIFKHNDSLIILEIKAFFEEYFQGIAPSFLSSNLSTIYFIKDQRILDTSLDSSGLELTHKIEKSIEKFSHQLKEQVNNILKEYTEKSQELDSSFPERLFEEQENISEDSFNERFNKIKEYKEELSSYGLSVGQNVKTAIYSKENSKSLLIYLNDTEEKLAVFAVFFKKIFLFSEIINKKELSNKTIKIDKEKGFYFVTNDGLDLPLTLLSFGEQQEVILLYQLLFEVEKDSLVLIDEPETGLHVSWQQEFIKDLKRIIELQNFTAIVATHSPSIINNYWDLVIDLYELSESNEDALECEQ